MIKLTTKKLFSVTALGLLVLTLSEKIPVYATEKLCAHNYTCSNPVSGDNDLCDDCIENAGKKISYPQERTWGHNIIKRCAHCNGHPVGLEIPVECEIEGSSCKYCGREKTTTKCHHASCTNEAEETSLFCSVCYGHSFNDPISFVAEGEKCLRFLTHACCNTVDKSEYKHSYQNGVCYFCQAPQPATPSPSTGSESSNNTESEQHIVAEPQDETPVVAEPTRCTLKTSDGRNLTSSISSIYATSLVNGAAVVSPKTDIINALNIVDEGTNPSFYVCNSPDNFGYRSHIEYLINEQGYTAHRMISADMYSITKEGVITKVHSSNGTISLIFGLPNDLRDKGISILAYNNTTGKLELFTDTDSDPTTITINANVFGVYAFVTKN